MQGVQQWYGPGEEAAGAPPPARRQHSIPALTYRSDENQQFLIPLTRYRVDTGTPTASSAPASPSPAGNQQPQQPNLSSVSSTNAKNSPPTATPPTAPANGQQLVPVSGGGRVLAVRENVPPRPSLVGGVVKGLARGAVGVCVKPFAGVAELLAQTTQGLLVGAGLVAPRISKLDAAELARRYAIDVALSPHAMAVAYAFLSFNWIAAT